MLPAGGEQIRIRTAVYRKETPVAGIVAAMLMLAGVAGGLAYYFIEKGKQKPEGKSEVAVADTEAAGPIVKPAPKPRPPRDPVSNMERVDDRRAVPPSGRAGGQEDDDESRPFRVPAPVPPARPGKGKNGGKMPAADTDGDGMAGDAMAGDGMTEDGMDGADMQAARRPMKRPGPVGKPVTDKPVNNAADREALAKLDKPLGEALQALRDKDTEQAAAILEKAMTQAGKGAGADRVARWQELSEYYKGFLQFREQALETVKSGNEYDVNNQKVAIVEADREKVVYRSAGGNKTVTRDKIPAGIVLAIVTSWFGETKAANHLYLGAYHLAKPESDPPRARREFEAAEAGGADASGLMPLLDDPLFTAKAE